MAAFVLFVGWKFFLISVMWNGRSIPPEPDDMFEYVGHIASVLECNTIINCPYPGVSMTDHSGFSYLSYRILMGIVGKVFDSEPITILRTGFYLGTILLTAVLIPFLRSFTENKSLLAWSILFLAFYHGTGETHGFFWVVPSFFSLLLFLALFTYIASEQSIFRTWIAIPLSIIYVFTHPISVYLSFIFPLYTIILSFFSKKLEITVFKKTSLVLIIVLTSTLLQTSYLKGISQPDYYGINQSISEASKSFKTMIPTSKAPKEQELGYDITSGVATTLFEQRITSLNTVYFRYVIPHWIALVPLLGVYPLILFREKNFRLLSLYLSSLIFFVISTLSHEFGFRSAIVLWPVTFIFYAFGSWHLLTYTEKIESRIWRILSKTVMIIGVTSFLLVNITLSYIFNQNLNSRHKYAIDPSFSQYLKENLRPNERVRLNAILVRTKGGADLYLKGKVATASEIPAYIAVIDESSILLPTENKFLTSRKIAYAIADRLGIPTRTDSKPIPPSIPLGYHLEKEFGVIKIYQKDF